jgi:hypothetical protein
MDSPPEDIPRFARLLAHEDVGAVLDGAVLDSERNDYVAGKLAALENGFEFGAPQASCDNRFRRWIAIPPQPMRV